MSLESLVQQARSNHQVLIPNGEGYDLQSVDVSPVVHDQSWLEVIADLLAGIGASINVDALREYRRFVFFRLEDPTGVSSELIGGGARIVVAGVELPTNGHLAFVWFGSKVPSLTIHTSIENAMLAHGHGLKTQFVYV